MSPFKTRERKRMLYKGIKGSHSFIVKDARDTSIFEIVKAFEHFTRQVKETCMLNQRTQLTSVSFTIKERRIQRKIMKTVIKVCKGNI